MCRERHRTRDLLLEYKQDLMPYHPRAGGLSIVYPWENNQLFMLKEQIFQIAVDSGFQGTEDDFWERLGDREIITGDSIANFPVPGNPKHLYLDLSSGTTYYFKKVGNGTDLPPGTVVVGLLENTQFVYIPIRALLLEDATISGGDV